MAPVGLGDLAAAARALMAVPAHRRAGLMRAMIGEAELAYRYWQRFGRLHPGFGNGTLMSAALAHPQRRDGGAGDDLYLACLAEALEAVIAWRSGQAKSG